MFGLFCSKGWMPVMCSARYNLLVALLKAVNLMLSTARNAAYVRRRSQGAIKSLRRAWIHHSQPALGEVNRRCHWGSQTPSAFTDIKW